MEHQIMAYRAAEQAARQSYGKLVAFVAARTRDVPAAEDALAEALATALRVWPETGVPDNPEAWLLVAARRNAGRGHRHGKVVAEARETLLLAMDEAEQRTNQMTDALFPDDRLKLMFVCTHPAISRAVHTPLMLQTVLGLDARRIASAFLVSPVAMSQRIVRAKNKIREAGIPFAVPDTVDLASRLDGVLSAIYAAYSLGWDGLDGEDLKGGDLTEEAIWLTRALLSILPDQPEVLGLLSLMLYSEARKSARRTAQGGYVPLDRQSTTLWDKALIEEADALLKEAGHHNIFGIFQCEAAIQAVHAERRYTGETNWPAIALLYQALVRMKPSIGAYVGQAAVVGRVEGAGAGLACLDRIESQDRLVYQPYWAVRAHLLEAMERHADAIEAYDTAIGLSESDAVRRFLREKYVQLSSAFHTSR